MRLSRITKLQWAMGQGACLGLLGIVPAADSHGVTPLCVAGGAAPRGRGLMGGSATAVDLPAPREWVVQLHNIMIYCSKDPKIDTDKSAV